MCVETTTRDAYEVEGQSDARGPAKNNPADPLDDMVEKRIAKVGSVSPRTFAAPLAPTARCGPAIRLTSSSPRRAGGVWYGRRLNVREGFDTTFVLKPSNPSTRCDLMHGAHSHCRSRGGDGFAFVVQEDRPTALGREGAGLGYDGINNSLAVEFDTFYNPELLDVYENHVSVHSNGWRRPNSAHEEASFAATARIPDLATFPDPLRTVRLVRVTYDPVFDPSLARGDAFAASPKVAEFFTNADFAGGGLPDFGNGLGTLSVYVRRVFFLFSLAQIGVVRVDSMTGGHLCSRSQKIERHLSRNRSSFVCSS